MDSIEKDTMTAEAIEEENMSRIAEQHPCIAEALMLEHSYWADEKERERYIAEQLYLIDELSAEKTIKAQGIKEGIEQGIEQGIEIGKSEGRNEAKIEMARALLANGVAPEVIAKGSGLSIDEILSL